MSARKAVFGGAMQPLAQIGKSIATRIGEAFHRSQRKTPVEQLAISADQMALRKPKPLVVVLEDEEVLRSLVCEYLNAAGYETFEAAGANEARKFLVEHKSRNMILVTDMVFPGEGGWSLAQQIRRDFPAFPVVFMSGAIDEFVVHQAVVHDNTAFLPKPFSRDALIGTLKSLELKSTSATSTPLKNGTSR